MNRVSTRQCIARSIAAALIGGLFGCATENASRQPPPERPAKAPHSGPGDGVSTQASILAEQSQRDVEAILKWRPPVAKPQSPQAATVPIPTQPPAILWNDAYALAERAGANAVNQSTLAQIPAPINLPIEPPAPAVPTANEAVAEPAPESAADRMRRLIGDLSRELYSAGSSSEAPLRELMVIAAMSVIDPQRQLNSQALPDLTDKERELLGYLQSFFTDLDAGLKQPDDLETTVAGAATKLHDSLIKAPQLALPVTALCTRVGGFGDYSTFEKNSFLAGSGQRVIVYLEIDHFTSQLNASGEFVTELSQQLTIYADRDGIPVWKEDWQTAIDRSKNQRQDFFTVQVVTLPRALSVGKYQLKVRVRDDKSKAEAEASIPFEMLADPRLTSK